MCECVGVRIHSGNHISNFSQIIEKKEMYCSSLNNICGCSGVCSVEGEVGSPAMRAGVRQINQPVNIRESVFSSNTSRCHTGLSRLHQTTKRTFRRTIFMRNATHCISLYVIVMCVCVCVCLSVCLCVYAAFVDFRKSV